MPPNPTLTQSVKLALQVADKLPSGPEQVAAAERAVSLAEQLGDFPLRVQARINLVAAYDAAGSSDRELAHIAWLLGALDKDADLTERQRFEILWEARFALVITRNSSRLDLRAVRRIYGDVEARFRRSGVSPNLYAKHRALLADEIDIDETRDRWLQVWRNSPRDRFSDCAICDLATDARFHAAGGDYAAALGRVAEILESGRTCDLEPHGILGAAADWAMRLGRVDEAESHHRRGWPLVQGRARFVGAAGEHLMYLLRADRPGRALRLVPHLYPLLDGPEATGPEPDRMRAKAVAARVLRAGRGRQAAPAEIDGVALNDTITEFEQQARATAAAFDARNGNNRVSKRLAAHTRLAPYPQLASTEARAIDRLDLALCRPAGFSVPTASDDADRPTTVLGYAGELLRASEAFDADQVMSLINGWVGDRDQLIAKNRVEHFGAAYLDRRALASNRAQEDEAFVETLLADAQRHAQESESAPAMQRIEIELLHRHALAGDSHAWGKARKLAEELAATGELTEAASALMSLSRNPDAKRGMLDAIRASELFHFADAPRWRAVALQAAGYAAIWVDPERSEELLGEAKALADEHHIDSAAVSITATRAKLAWRRGDHDTALRFMREAVGNAAAAPDPSSLRMELCDFLLEAGDWEDLTDVALDLLETLPDSDIPRRAMAQRWLGLGLLETGNPHEAVEALEPARAGLADSPLLTVTSWTLGRAWLAVDRPDLAAEPFESAARGFKADGRFGDAAAAYSAAGAMRQRMGELGVAATQLLDAARLARFVGDVDQMVGALRQLANVQGAQERINDALATLGTVLREARAVAAEPMRRQQEERLLGQIEHQAAEILMRGGRTDEAEKMLEISLRRLSSYGEANDVTAAEDTYFALTGRNWS